MILAEMLKVNRPIPFGKSRHRHRLIYGRFKIREQTIVGSAQAMYQKSSG